MCSTASLPIQSDRLQMRTALYMAMMSAMQYNPKFKATYARFLTAGKPKKVAIIACVQKMVMPLNSMLRDDAMWNENTAKN
jgi:transposase